ncbi:unnamed protein product [Prorocentrum cordatum]|uniref:R3H domain-containing protein n=1 Tax=Prorocentrum cordatum TaxID=2364126 RepID=A0ABN9WR95_9DINO|nr:unnamed protein product [Polarella glacialis]
METTVPFPSGLYPLPEQSHPSRGVERRLVQAPRSAVREAGGGGGAAPAPAAGPAPARRSAAAGAIGPQAGGALEGYPETAAEGAASPGAAASGARARPRLPILGQAVRRRAAAREPRPLQPRAGVPPLQQQIMLPHFDVSMSARTAGRLSRPSEIPALAGGGSARGTRAPFATLGELLASQDNGGVLERRPEGAPGGSLGSPAMTLEEAKVAMAVELVGKCGSMSASWQKMNSNSTGKVSRSMFDAGLSVLHIDPAEVCGLPARRLFLEMSRGGQISQDSWYDFFRAALDGPDAAARLEEAERRYEEARQAHMPRSEVDENATGSEPASRRRQRSTATVSEAQGASPPAAAAPGGARGAAVAASGPARVSAWSASLGPHGIEATEAGQDARAHERPLCARRGLESGPGLGAHDGGGTAGASESEAVIEVKSGVTDEKVIEAHFPRLSEGDGLSDRERELSAKAFIMGATIAEALHSDHAFSVETVSEVEILAMAEEETLLQELAERKLEGIKALLYIFVAKFGSMDSAFKWFDINGNVNMSSLEWDTGVKLLRIDLKKLTDTSPRDFFASMARGGTDISLRSWREFFALAMEEMGEELLQEAAGARRAAPSLAERARQRAERLRAERRARREGTGAAEAAGGGGGAAFLDGLGELTPEEAALLRRLREQFGALAEGEGIEVADEVWGDRGLALARLVASELGLYLRDLDPAGAGVFVGNMSDFVERARRRLEGIEPGQSLEFEKELSLSQRQVVIWLAADLGLWTITQGRGTRRQVVAFNVGSFAEEARRRLQALAPAGLSAVQRRIVHLIAEELGLWTHSAGVGSDRYVEVFNLKAFALEVRGTLEALGPGQHHDFAPALSKEQRKVVHCIATELGLVSLSQENAEGERYVSAGNLHDFRGQVRNQMEQLDKGESKAIHASGWGTAKFTVLQMKAIRLAASDLGMAQAGGGGGEELQVTSPRPARPPSAGSAEAAGAPGAAAGAAEKDSGRKRRRRSEEGRRSCSKEGVDDDDQMRDLFDELCTGSYNGQKLFTSLVDLKVLLEELREVMPVRKQRLKKDWARLESIFEDTVQLQVDFGTRTRKGLTYQWFQTFIQKVANHFDMSVMGMLLLLAPAELD